MIRRHFTVRCNRQGARLLGQSGQCAWRVCCLVVSLIGSRYDGERAIQHCAFLLLRQNGIRALKEIVP